MGLFSTATYKSIINWLFLYKKKCGIIMLMDWALANFLNTIFHFNIVYFCIFFKIKLLLEVKLIWSDSILSSGINKCMFKKDIGLNQNVH